MYIMAFTFSRSQLAAIISSLLLISTDFMDLHEVEGSGYGIALLSWGMLPRKKALLDISWQLFHLFSQIPFGFHRFSWISGVRGWHHIVAMMLPLKKTLLTSSWLLPSSIHRFIAAGCYHRFIDSPSSDLVAVPVGWARMGWVGLDGWVFGWMGWMAGLLSWWLAVGCWLLARRMDVDR